jgi:ATP-binding cassette subfamily C (CFTR/MRP) protein 1
VSGFLDTMTDFSSDKAPAIPEPQAAAQSTNHEEPLDVDNTEKDFIDSSSQNGSFPSSERHGFKDEDEEKRPKVNRLESHATNTSVGTQVTEAPPEQKPWYKKANPLRWGAIPPVPETRSPSREHTASFFSLIYFQWMAPMMAVSALDIYLNPDLTY